MRDGGAVNLAAGPVKGGHGQRKAEGKADSRYCVAFTSLAPFNYDFHSLKRFTCNSYRPNPGRFNYEVQQENAEAKTTSGAFLWACQSPTKHFERHTGPEKNEPQSKPCAAAGCGIAAIAADWVAPIPLTGSSSATKTPRGSAPQWPLCRPRIA